jgi:hypothetical protein
MFVALCAESEVMIMLNCYIIPLISPAPGILCTGCSSISSLGVQVLIFWAAKFPEPSQYSDLEGDSNLSPPYLAPY